MKTAVYNNELRGAQQKSTGRGGRFVGGIWMAVDRRGFCGIVAGGMAATLVPLAPQAATAGEITFEATEGELQLAPAPAATTPVWGYNGKVPGPLLRVKKGDELAVRLVNKLGQPTSLCWHGVRVANAMDGVAGLTQSPVAPGATVLHRFTPPDAGLFWYHPHVFPQSAEQIGRGLYGVLIVDEPDPPKVDQDILLVLDDWSLDAKGQIAGDWLDPAQARGAGRIGSRVTVNSQPTPLALAVRPGARLRVRVLNACAARIALVGFYDARPTFIAIDGQPSELFRPARDTVPIGPGSRFEVMLDVPTREGVVNIALSGMGEADVRIVEIAIKGVPLPANPPVAKLPDNPLLPTRIPLERALKHDLVVAPAAAGDSRWAWSLGGAPSDGLSTRPLFKVKRGGAVTLGFVNKSAQVQQMHVHGHVFRVLHDLDDGWDPYWRDSVLVGPGRTKHVAFVADNPGKWAIESLMLDRQVTGLAGWFEVV